MRAVSTYLAVAPSGGSFSLVAGGEVALELYEGIRVFNCASSSSSVCTLNSSGSYGSGEGFRMPAPCTNRFKCVMLRARHELICERWRINDPHCLNSFKHPRHRNTCGGMSMKETWKMGCNLRSVFPLCVFGESCCFLSICFRFDVG